MRGIRLDPQKRVYLRNTYVRKGLKAAAPIAEKFGVTAKYLSKLARDAGHRQRSRSTGASA